MTGPRTPAELLAHLARTDPTRPRLTWYDDADGPTRGERIELSGRVLDTWTAKAASMLADDLDVERGSVVRLDLPPHWRAVYWALAAWRVGAEVALAAAPSADVVVTASPESAQGAPASTHVLAVSLPALARRWAGPELAAGVVDEAAELAAHPDVFEPFDEPDAADVALRDEPPLTAAGLVAAARDLARERGWAAGERVAYLGDGGPQPLRGVLLAALAVWDLDGSLVLVRAGWTPTDLTDRWASERVTSVAGPGGSRPSRG